MSKVDDELTRRFRRVERPVDVDGMFEGLERRRSHRERVRKVQTGALAVAVLATSIAGFLVLRSVFREGPPIGGPPTPRNGEIVFSRPLPDGSQHLFAVRPGVPGERLITSGGAAWYADPSVSPDGRTIVATHSIPSFADSNVQDVIATVAIEGGAPTWLTEPFTRLGDPSWSPEGTRIAFAGRDSGEESSGIYVMNTDGSDMRLVAELDGFELSAPDWSPDGRTLVFVGLSGATGKAQLTHPDLYSVGLDGSGLTNLTDSTEVSEWSPSWSPDGDEIAYHHNEASTVNRVQLIDVDGDPVGIVFDDADASEIGEVDWSPDGEFLAFTSGLALTDSDNEGDLDVWTIRRDGSDLRNLTTEGARGLTWAAASDDLSISPEPSAEPSPSPSPEPAGRDIGLGVRMCDLEVLTDIDRDGTGIDGAAWTGAPVDEDGTCASATLAQHVVAVDRDGDGLAEQGSTSTLRSCLLCRPFDTVDLNDDGVLELVVLEEASSTPTYSVHEVNRPGSERAEGVYSVIVVAPGAPAMNLDANQTVRFTVGGDEGFSGSIGCEDAGAGPPILRYTWVRGAVDADSDLEVDVTRLRFGEDGVFSIESVDRFSVPRNPEPIDLKSTEPACGVDFHPDP